MDWTITVLSLTLPKIALDNPLLCYSTIELNKAVKIIDLKLVIVEGKKVIRFPSKKSTLRCDACEKKNPHDAAYCNRCGNVIDRLRSEYYYPMLRVDNADLAKLILKTVLEAYYDKWRDTDVSNIPQGLGVSVCGSAPIAAS